MDHEPRREEFKSERAFQGIQRLLDARSELNHGSWLGARCLSPKQKEEGLFWALLSLDPLIEVYDQLPQEVRAGFPPLPELGTIPPGVGILARDMEKLQRVARLFAMNESAVLQALKVMV